MPIADDHVLYLWMLDERLSSFWMFFGTELLEISCIRVDTVSKWNILIGRILEETNNGIAWDLVLQKNLP